MLNKTAQNIPATYKGEDEKAPAAPAAFAPGIPQYHGEEPFKKVEPQIKPKPTGNAPPARSALPANQSVKEMQSAIIGIYDTLKYYPMFNKNPNYREQDPSQYSANYEHGSDTFLTFLLNRFVNKSPIIGQEYSTSKPNAKDLNKGIDSGASPINLIRLIETLRTLGKHTTSKEVREPDGVWDVYTNNALKNLYAITQAMFNLMDRLKVKSSNYNQADLDQLKGLIPQNPATIANKAKAAKLVSKNIFKIKKLIADFMNSVNRERGKYNAYVRQEKPFETSLGESKPYSQEDQDVYGTMSKTVIGMIPKDLGTGNGTASITMLDLTDRKYFENFINVNKITFNGKSPLEDVDARNKLFSAIESVIKNFTRETKKTDELLRDRK